VLGIRRIPTAAAATVLALNLALAPPWALAETPAEIASLAGLAGVEVVVENVPASIRKLGLRPDRLRADVEETLRSRGVPVVSESSALDGSPTLHLRVRSHSAEGGLLYSVALMLSQGVSVFGSPVEPKLAITWEAEAMGFSARSSRFDVQNAVLGLTGSFVNDFLSANPGD
jgi:hypothetical protein